MKRPTKSHQDRNHSGAASDIYKENYAKIDWDKGRPEKSYIVDKKLPRNKTRYGSNR